MEIDGRVAMITGGAGGIAAAMAKALKDAGAGPVWLLDRRGSAVAAVAERLGVHALECDVTVEAEVEHSVQEVLAAHGRVDLFFSNAGAMGEPGGIEATNAGWNSLWDLHVMSHLYAARAVVPSMIERGEGYLIQTASAAGLLAATGWGPYTVSKAAAVKLAEFFAISHGDDGIRVSVLCPQGVNTAMAPVSDGDGRADGLVEPELVAEMTLDAIADERFFVFTHPEVVDYVERKVADPDRWLSGMRRLRRRSA